MREEAKKLEDFKEKQKETRKKVFIHIAIHWDVEGIQVIY